MRDGLEDVELTKLMEKINKIAEENQFFHWYIEFPEVFSSERSGFDCILTNSPWDVLEFKELEFFIGFNENIISALNQSQRRRLIENLKIHNPELYGKYKKSWQNLKKSSHFLKTSDLFEFSSKGKLNTYALFVERCWRTISPNGYAGTVLFFILRILSNRQSNNF